MSITGNGFLAVDVIVGVIFFAALFDSPISTQEKILLGSGFLWIIVNIAMRGIENLNLHELNNKLILALFDVHISLEEDQNKGKTKKCLDDCIGKLQFEARLGKAWSGHELFYFWLILSWIGIGALIAYFL